MTPSFGCCGVHTHCFYCNHCCAGGSYSLNCGLSCCRKRRCCGQAFCKFCKYAGTFNLIWSKCPCWNSHKLEFAGDHEQDFGWIWTWWEYFLVLSYGRLVDQFLVLSQTRPMNAVDYFDNNVWSWHCIEGLLAMNISNLPSKSCSDTDKTLDFGVGVQGDTGSHRLALGTYTAWCWTLWFHPLLLWKLGYC